MSAPLRVGDPAPGGAAVAIRARAGLPVGAYSLPPDPFTVRVVVMADIVARPGMDMTPDPIVSGYAFDPSAATMTEDGPAVAVGGSQFVARLLAEVEEKHGPCVWRVTRRIPYGGTVERMIVGTVGWFVVGVVAAKA